MGRSCIGVSPQRLSEHEIGELPDVHFSIQGDDPAGLPGRESAEAGTDPLQESLSLFFETVEVSPVLDPTQSRLHGDVYVKSDVRQGEVGPSEELLHSIQRKSAPPGLVGQCGVGISLAKDSLSGDEGGGDALSNVFSPVCKEEKKLAQRMGELSFEEKGAKRKPSLPAAGFFCPDHRKGVLF